MMPHWLVDAALVLLALKAVGCLARFIRLSPETGRGALDVLVAVAIFAIEMAAVWIVWQ